MDQAARDDRAAFVSAVASGTIIAQQVAGRATRDALFLASFAASKIPIIMAAGAVLSFAGVIALARALARFSPARVVPASFAASAALLLVEWGLSLTAPAAASVVFYLHFAVLGASLISAFWSLVNERFDPHSARQFMGRIAGGGTAGGVIGGLFAWRASRVMSAPSMLVSLAVMSFVAAALTFSIGSGVTRPLSAAGELDDPVGEEASGSFAGVRALRESSHLRDLALLVGLGAVSAALFDVALSTEAAAAIPNREDLLSFFALFHLVVSVLSFALQAGVANVALERLGLAGTVGILPGVVLASSLSIVVAPRLWAASIVRAAEAVLRNSLFRSGYELLYTPLPPDQKRSVKTLIDVGFDRIGTALGSGLSIVVLASTTRASLPLLLGVGSVAAAATLVFTPRLHRGYVAALEGSLRSGAVSLEPANIVDATTRRTLSGTIDALSRDRILAELAALRKANAARGDLDRGERISQVGAPSGRAGERLSSPGVYRASGEIEAADPVLAAIADLRSGDVERARRVLARELDPALVAHVIPLLGRDGLVSDAVRALRAVAPRAIGQLLDALLDPAATIAIRRRVSRVIEACPTQRAVDGLMLGLADERFDVRYQSGVALARMFQQGAPLALRREDVIAAAAREIEGSRQLWETQRSGAPAADGGSAPHGADRLLVERTTRSFEHVFRVLSLTLEREPLALAYRALQGPDPHLRGTALEYLENILPEPIRVGLVPYLGARSQPQPAVARPVESARDTLLRSAASIPRGPASLRRGLKRAAPAPDAPPPGAPPPEGPPASGPSKRG